MVGDDLGWPIYELLLDVAMRFSDGAGLRGDEEGGEDRERDGENGNEEKDVRPVSEEQDCSEDEAEDVGEGTCSTETEGKIRCDWSV